MTTRVLIRDACIADGQSADLQVGMSLLIEGDHIAWIRPNDSADPTDADIVERLLGEASFSDFTDLFPQ